MRPVRLPERRRSWNAGLRERFRQLEQRWNELHPPVPIHESINSRASDPELPWSIGLSSDSLTSLHTHRSNVLLVGPEAHVARVLPAITRLVTPPIESCAAGRLALPTRLVGTLVLRNAHRLSVDEQQELFGWMSAASIDSQVITTATIPLFPLVLRKHFSDALFYRLTEMCLIVK